ncbi:hypothetical protein HOY82DRAFT_652430, partial [Tuber indicum]
SPTIYLSPGPSYLASGIKPDPVGIWITKESRFYTCAIGSLFPQWGIEFVGNWVWVVITSSRKPIFHLESRARYQCEFLV